MADAVITGITGQDGQYLARLLLEKGYRVVGTSRDGAPVAGLDVAVQRWDLRDEDALAAIVRAVQPDEFYNLAAYSSGAAMYDRPVDIGDINGLAVTRILEAIRQASPRTRLCQASSSEVFGIAAAAPQDEDTPVNPRSPYGAAKAYADAMIGIYRARYGLFACSAVLFNHESPLRGEAFVTRKIARAAALARCGRLATLPLGDLDATRDWGFAGDTVDAMWRMLQADTPADYVVATGQQHSVRDLCAFAFGHVSLDYRDYVVVDPAAMRAREAVPLVGDASRAWKDLGWRPRTDLRLVIAMMVDAELAAAA